MVEKIIIIGGGEHARVISEAICLSSDKYELMGYVNDDIDKKFEIPCIGADADLPSIILKYPDAKFVCGIGKNSIRRKVVDKLKCIKNRWAVLIHPEASVAANAQIGEGTVVLRRAIIQPSVCIEEQCIINSGTIVEHDSRIGSYSHVAPGVVTGGAVNIGELTFIGLGTRIRDHINIGQNVTVGTGSVVASDIGDNYTVVGAPARPIGHSRRERENIDELCIPPETTLHEAMLSLAKNGAAALITDPEMHLLGILNDGDVRRAVLEHYSMDTPVSKVMNENCLSVNEKVSRVAALDILKATGHRLMPIVDDSGKVVGLHLIDTMIGSLTLPNVALIMAGGKGTRLRPLTETIPKPMVRVAGRPILEHIILHLASAGIRDIYLSINYLGEVIEDYFKDGSMFGVKIHYLREEMPLGTGGSLTLLPNQTEPIIVMNGDLITQFDVARMLRYHKQGEYKMTIGAHNYRVDIPYGVIHWNEKEDKVDNIIEKPEKYFLVNGGIYVIDPALIDLIEPNKNIPITELIDKCIKNNIRVGAHLVEGDWIDVGHHSQLAAARGI